MVQILPRVLLLLLLLLLGSSGAASKYVFVREGRYWPAAQQHCRDHHTDLAPVGNRRDIEKLRKLAGNISVYMWIGLKRDSADSEEWWWSGGGRVTKDFWAENEPRTTLGRDYGVIKGNSWYTSPVNYKDPFFCYSAIVVREEKTWEEALDHCREHHHDLASVTTETEMLLIQGELQKYVTTTHVWIGLHSFPGEWLWVDGEPLDYEAWGPEGKPACPQVQLECAALKRTGWSDSGTETQETVGTSFNTGSYGRNTDVFGGSDQTADVWEAHNCKKKLHFICY